MKRVLTFDFTRGIAIIGVLLFHVLNVAFSDRVDEIEDALFGGGDALQWFEAAWYVLGPVLLVLGAFNGFFLMISAASNAISVHKQWERWVVEKEMDKTIAFKRIFTAQALRGALIWGFGFLSEGVLSNLLAAFVEFLKGEPVRDLAIRIPNSLLVTNILSVIGLSIILTSFIQLLYLKRGWSRSTISKILIVLVIACTAVMSLTRAIAMGLFGSDTFTSGIEGLPFLDLLARFLLAPFIGRLTPLVPFFSCAAFGLLLSINIAEGAITPNFLRKCLYGGILLVASSFIVGIATGIDIGNRERVMFYQLFILGLEIMALSFLVYMIDFRKKTNVVMFKKWTTGIRRFGILTLSLWMLQYVIIFPVLLIQVITTWPIIQGGLNDWQLVIVLLLLLGMWHLVLVLWERVRFTGSLEWVMSLALSGRGSSGDRKAMPRILHDVEDMIEHVPGTAIDAKEKAMVIACIMFACFYGLVIGLVAGGIVSL